MNKPDARSGPAAAPPGRRARVLAVTSGKGGVGRTFVSANLAAALAMRDERVLVLDADLGLANLDVVLFSVSLADEVVLVVTPEPTAMTDAYATAKVLATQQQRELIGLVVNQTGRLGEARTVCGQLQRVVDRYVNPAAARPLRLELVGEIPSDAAVREAVQGRQLLLEVYPGSSAAKAVIAIAARLAP